MKCIRCGGTYIKFKGERLESNEPYVGLIVLDKAEFSRCDGCNERLFSPATCDALDREAKLMLDRYLQSQPFSSLKSAKETADILEISKQALSKNSRIKRGFIFSTIKDGKKYYLTRSINLYKETGDGRFPIYTQVIELETSEMAEMVQTDIDVETFLSGIALPINSERMQKYGAPAQTNTIH